MTHQPGYDFYAALHAILARVTEAERAGSDSEALRIVRQDAQRYRRQLDMLQAELERMLDQTAPPAARSATRDVQRGALPAKRLACHHADSADAARLVEGDLPPWMIDCSEPH